jgi:hypothetical protein
VSLPGVELLDVAVLGNNDRALGRVIGRAEFAARLPEDADVAAALAAFGGGAPLATRRASEKGLDRVVDVRRSLGVFAAFDDADVRARLDWATGPLVRFAVSVTHEGSARPVEVVRALFGEDVAERADLARLALWSLEGDAQVDPMRLEQLRRHAPPRAAVGDAAVATAP